MPRPVLGRLRPQPQHCSGYNFTTVSTRSTGTNGRFRPACPGCPPGLRLLFLFPPRCRGEPASPSDEGYLMEESMDYARMSFWRKTGARAETHFQQFQCNVVPFFVRGGNTVRRNKQVQIANVNF